MKRIFILIGILFSLTLFSGCQLQIKNSSPTIKQTIAKRQFINLKIAANNSTDIEFRSSHANSIVYHGPKNSRPSANFKGNTLTISQKSADSQIHFFPFGFSINGNKNSTIIVYLTKKELNKLTVNDDNNDITAKTTLNVKKLNLSSENGDLSLKKLKVNQGKISADNGDVEISSLVSKAGFEITAENGDVTINQNNATGFNLSADNGDLSINNHDQEDTDRYRQNINSENVLKVFADNGDIEIN